MAILENMPGAKVEIIVDGTPLQEYDDDNEPLLSRQITKYIESQTGKEFVVKVTFAQPFMRRDVAICVAFDGNPPITTRHVSASDLLKPAGHLKSSSVTRSGSSWYERKFTFNALDTVEDTKTVSALMRKKVMGLGVITVTLHNCGPLRTVYGDSRGYRAMEDIGVVPEKAMKGDAKSHIAGLTGPVFFKRDYNNSSTKFDYLGDGPFATFRFKYRSLKNLQALHVVPPPVPLEDRPVEELTPQEAQELIRQLKKRDASGRVKQEVPTAKKEATKENPWSIDDEDSNDDVEVLERPSAPEADGGAQHEANRDDPMVIDDDDEDEEEIEEIERSSARKRVRGKDGRFIKKT